MRRTALAKLGLAAGVTAAAAVLSLSAASSAPAQSLQTAAPASQADCYDSYSHTWFPCDEPVCHYDSYSHIWYC